jgi:hypothetical protein
VTSFLKPNFSAWFVSFGEPRAPSSEKLVQVRHGDETEVVLRFTLSRAHRRLRSGTFPTL